VLSSSAYVNGCVYKALNMLVEQRRGFCPQASVRHALSMTWLLKQMECATAVTLCCISAHCPSLCAERRVGPEMPHILVASLPRGTLGAAHSCCFFAAWDLRCRSLMPCRRTYQRAVVIPTNHAETLWRSYESWEIKLDKQLGKKVGMPAHICWCACTPEGACRSRTFWPPCLGAQKF